MEPRVIEIPDELGEPPLHTVVLDRNRQVWQRHPTYDGSEETTWGTWGFERRAPWGVLLLELGPLTVLYEPDTADRPGPPVEAPPGGPGNHNDRAGYMDGA